ncbi:hypothetical protein MRB53_028222 [Persea americana]|uniref:Uncharacterized protein n=1 Tax=Persea americana TaxID=3435 RepID=A0ACC2KFL0_PERAE|nr:hypothetical protein MRB53_028222 [Persea americana]
MITVVNTQQQYAGDEKNGQPFFTCLLPRVLVPETEPDQRRTRTATATRTPATRGEDSSNFPVTRGTGSAASRRGAIPATSSGTAVAVLSLFSGDDHKELESPVEKNGVTQLLYCAHL